MPVLVRCRAGTDRGAAAGFSTLATARVTTCWVRSAISTAEVGVRHVQQGVADPDQHQVHLGRQIVDLGDDADRGAGVAGVREGQRVTRKS